MIAAVFNVVARLQLTPRSKSSPSSLLIQRDPWSKDSSKFVWLVETEAEMYLGTMWWIVLVIFATAVVSQIPTGAAYATLALHLPQLNLCRKPNVSAVEREPNLKWDCWCLQVVSVCTFLLQWGGCCIQHTDHTGTHVRVQIGWGYGFDMHRGRHMLEGVSHSSQKIPC